MELFFRSSKSTAAQDQALTTSAPLRSYDCYRPDLFENASSEEPPQPLPLDAYLAGEYNSDFVGDTSFQTLVKEVLQEKDHESPQKGSSKNAAGGAVTTKKSKEQVPETTGNGNRTPARTPQMLPATSIQSSVQSPPPAHLTTAPMPAMAAPPHTSPSPPMGSFVDQVASSSGTGPPGAVAGGGEHEPSSPLHSMWVKAKETLSKGLFDLQDEEFEGRTGEQGAGTKNAKTRGVSKSRVVSITLSDEEGDPVGDPAKTQQSFLDSVLDRIPGFADAHGGQSGDGHYKPPMSLSHVHHIGGTGSVRFLRPQGESRRGGGGKQLRAPVALELLEITSRSRLKTVAIAEAGGWVREFYLESGLSTNRDVFVGGRITDLCPVPPALASFASKMQNHMAQMQPHNSRSSSPNLGAVRADSTSANYQQKRASSSSLQPALKAPDRLHACDATRGLIEVNCTKKSSRSLVTEFEGAPIGFATSCAADKSTGLVYFTDACSDITPWLVYRGCATSGESTEAGTDCTTQEDQKKAKRRSMFGLFDEGGAAEEARQGWVDDRGEETSTHPSGSKPGYYRSYAVEEALAMDVLRFQPKGRVFCYDPSTGKTVLIKDKLYTPTAVVVLPAKSKTVDTNSAAPACLLIAEASKLRISKFDALSGELYHVIADRVPGVVGSLSLLSSVGSGAPGAPPLLSLWCAFSSVLSSDNFATAFSASSVYRALPTFLQSAINSTVPARKGLAVKLDVNTGDLKEYFHDGALFPSPVRKIVETSDDEGCKLFLFCSGEEVGRISFNLNDMIRQIGRSKGESGGNSPGALGGGSSPASVFGSPSSMYAKPMGE
eukprot:g3520.t1